jgi:DNA-binding response OmpR family regulator
MTQEAIASPRIIIFEPDEKYRDFYSQHLELVGYRPLVLESRSQVIDEVGSIEPPKLIILGEEYSADRHPRGPSLQTLGEIREVSTAAVMFADYHEQDYHIARVLESGADQYWIKGRRTGTEFLAFSRALLRRSVPAYMQLSPNVPDITNGGLVITPSGRVTVEGVDISLSRQEFKALRTLGVNLGEIVTYSDINKALYGDTPYDSHAAARVFISRVRQKFVEAGVEPPIVTKQGVGYLMPKYSANDEE